MHHTVLTIDQRFFQCPRPRIFIILLAKDPAWRCELQWLRLWLYGNERRLSHRPVPVRYASGLEHREGTPGNAYR